MQGKWSWGNAGMGKVGASKGQAELRLAEKHRISALKGPCRSPLSSLPHPSLQACSTSTQSGHPLEQRWSSIIVCSSPAQTRIKY